MSDLTVETNTITTQATTETDEITSGIEKAKRFVPEIEDFDSYVVEALFKICLEKHSDNSQEILRYYLLGYLLTSSVDAHFEELTISNLVLKTKDEDDNPYLKMYNKLAELMGANSTTTISIWEV